METCMEKSRLNNSKALLLERPHRYGKILSYHHITPFISVSVMVPAPRPGCCSRSLASSGLTPRSGSARDVQTRETTHGLQGSRHRPATASSSTVRAYGRGTLGKTRSRTLGAGNKRRGIINVCLRKCRVPHHEMWNTSATVTHVLATLQLVPSPSPEQSGVCAQAQAVQRRLGNCSSPHLQRTCRRCG